MLSFRTHRPMFILVAAGYLFIALSANGLHNHLPLALDLGVCRCNSALPEAMSLDVLRAEDLLRWADECRRNANKPVTPPSPSRKNPPADGPCLACLFLLTAQSDAPAAPLFVIRQPVAVSPRTEQAEPPPAPLILDRTARSPPVLS